MFDIPAAQWRSSKGFGVVGHYLGADVSGSTDEGFWTHIWRNILSLIAFCILFSFGSNSILSTRELYFRMASCAHGQSPLHISPHGVQAHCSSASAAAADILEAHVEG